MSMPCKIKSFYISEDEVRERLQLRDNEIVAKANIGISYGFEFDTGVGYYIVEATIVIDENGEK